jgi:hypothetical protein
MFRTVRPNFYKSFYSTVPEFYNHNNYKNNGSGGGNDPKLFYLFLLGLTIYTVNKIKK